MLRKSQNKLKRLSLIVQLQFLAERMFLCSIFFRLEVRWNLLGGEKTYAGQINSIILHNSKG